MRLLSVLAASQSGEGYSKLMEHLKAEYRDPITLQRSSIVKAEEGALDKLARLGGTGNQ
jgi:hypothetical protein